VLALIGGTVFIVLLVLADTMVMAPLAELPDKSASAQFAQAQTILTLEDVSWVVQGAAGVGAALMIIAASLGARRGGAAGRLMFGVSLALGALSGATIAFIGVC
jgi:hypothetical protein